MEKVITFDDQSAIASSILVQKLMVQLMVILACEVHLLAAPKSCGNSAAFELTNNLYAITTAVCRRVEKGSLTPRSRKWSAAKGDLPALTSSVLDEQLVLLVDMFSVSGKFLLATYRFLLLL
ncbi:hypothetical protein VNO80_20170 [Phaseolus coccineus]|uniref:Uncharacterized protein n=1 Tax=Phaseolus coccineus TaxID=3886 RepID=A0AAN9MM99_PHACN